jgi:hypothetical protein
VDIVAQHFAQVGNSLVNRVVNVGATMPDRFQKIIRAYGFPGLAGEVCQHSHQPGLERDDSIAIGQAIEIWLNEPGS